MYVTSRTKPVKKQLEPPPPGPPPPPSECREQASETNTARGWQKEFCPLIVIWRKWEWPGTPILEYLWLKLYLYCIWASIPWGVCLFQRLSSCPACYTNKPKSERRHQSSHSFLTSFAWLTHPHALSREGLRWFSLESLSCRLLQHTTAAPSLLLLFSFNVHTISKCTEPGTEEMCISLTVNMTLDDCVLVSWTAC